MTLQSCPKLVNYRLRRDVIPTRYVLSVKPDKDSMKHEGTAKITLHFKRPTNEITLISAAGVVLDKVHIQLKNRTINGNVSYCANENTATITVDEEITEEKAVLSYKFRGQMEQSSTDLYRLKKSNESKFGFVTKYTPTYAIPCFSDPSFKATFSMSVVTETNKTVMSNMPVKSTKHLDSNLTKTTFETTPPMSTFLMAMIDGYYDSIEKKLENRSLVIRVHTPPGKKEFGQFALETAEKVLKFYENYFNVSFPLPKLDIATLDVLDSVMLENWGLMTFEPHYLLIDNNTSDMIKQQLIGLMCKKMSHQWLGHLVTIDWLTETWLFYGITTLLHYKCGHEMFPDWKVYHHFVSKKTKFALSQDAQPDAIRLERWINNPNLFSHYFTFPSNTKGTAVIKMLESWIGTENFTKGIHDFIENHKYGNAKTRDFWAVMKNVSNKPVNVVMKTWTIQPGFPLITIGKPNCKICKGFEVTQKKFSEDGFLTEKELQMLWRIPITYIIDNTTQSQTLLESNNDTLVRKNAQNKIILVNSASDGYFRTQYYKEVYDELFKMVQAKKYDVVTRFTLQNDFFAIAKAGKESTADYLNYLKAYIAEEESVIWESIDHSLEEIQIILEDTDLKNKFGSFVKQLMKNIGNQVGWEQKANELVTTTQLRSLVLSRLGLAGDEQVVQESLKRLEQHLNKIKPLELHLQEIVCKIVVANEKGGYFEKFMNMYRNSNNSVERHLLKVGMGATRNETQIRKLIDFAMSSVVPDQDTIDMLLSVTSSSTGKVILWEYFVDNQTELRSIFETDPSWLRLIHGIVSAYSCSIKAQEFEQYFQDNPSAGSEEVLKNALHIVRQRANWRQRCQKAIRDFFESHHEYD
ncbi:hypothetical protein B4U80_03628 [Leptotrombidium deliense]|uniref:Aminopeptidase n=1 Tax=Leptotrombidium deliense TaxID=299467 RepID=A0A443SCK6_9ACAR|nr:hypothetical protein B4U80_03628 [Leptotrombidium deliense]